MGKIGQQQNLAKPPAPSNTQLGKQVPDIFRTQRPATPEPLLSNMAPASSRSAPTPQTECSLDPGVSDTHISYLQHLPTRAELNSVASDIKDALCSAVSELRKDVQDIGRRLHEVERTGCKQEEELRAVHLQHDCTVRNLIDMRRHLEDLDNRGRRSNIRIRGVPETYMPDAISTVIRMIFNDVLGRPMDSSIELVRAHRALRPRAAQEDMPRDIICCLQSFPLKEEILTKARQRGSIHLDGTEIKLFQDLSAITLQQRRALRPLLDCLRTHGILYRWRFPFSLTATHGGKTATLRLPEDIVDFCSRLELPEVVIPDWYSDLYSTAAPRRVLPVPSADDPVRRIRDSPRPDSRRQKKLQPYPPDASSRRVMGDSSRN